MEAAPADIELADGCAGQGLARQPRLDRRARRGRTRRRAAARHRLGRAAAGPETDNTDCVGSSAGRVVGAVGQLPRRAREVDRETGVARVLEVPLARLGHDHQPDRRRGAGRGRRHGHRPRALGGHEVRRRGRQLNPPLLDYKLRPARTRRRSPSASSDPAADGGPFGAKAVGEPPVVGPAGAVANAIAKRPARVRHLPMTPERVWEHLPKAMLVTYTPPTCSTRPSPRCRARVIAGGTESSSRPATARRRCPTSFVAIHGSPSCGSRRRRRACHRRARQPRDARGTPTCASGWTAVSRRRALIGSPATRYVGTLGGNLVNASPAMDTGAPLLVLGARSGCARRRRADGAGRRAVGGARAHRPRRPTSCSYVALPAPPARTGSAYVRLEYRRAMEIAVIGAAASVALDGDGTVARCARRAERRGAHDRARPGVEAALVGALHDGYARRRPLPRGRRRRLSPTCAPASTAAAPSA